MTDETIKVVPDGDIILTVSKGDHTVRFLVKSSQLCAASDVFAALLSPKFAEGQALAAKTSSPCEDDPYCMQMVLEVIHFKFDKLPQKIEDERILDLAVVIDKYFLHRAMAPAIDRLLSPTTAVDDLHNFLRAAILLKNTKAFTETTKLMLLHRSVSYTRKQRSDQDQFYQNLISALQCSHVLSAMPDD